MTGHLFSLSIVSGITLACLYLCYKAALSRTTFFRFNRTCILLIYLLAGLSPFLTFEIDSAVEVEPGAALAFPLDARGEHLAPSVSPMKYLLIIYLIGVVVMSLRFIADSLYLVYLKFSAVHTSINGVKVKIHANEKLSPFSWGGNIYLAGSILETPDADLELIIAHEQSHIDNHHWLDLILSNLTIIVQWYNPAAWLLHGELIRVHEFEADRNVMDSTDNPAEYQLLLIKRIAGSRFHSIADSLNNTSLKNRITMMTRNQSRSCARLRALALVPAIAAALCLTNSSCVKSACDKAEADNAPATEVAAAEQNASAAVVEAENHDAAPVTESENVAKLPEFEGGMANLYNMLAKTIQYPKEAMDKNIEGRVTVKIVVGKNGEISDATIMNGIEKSLDDEAIAAIYRIKEAGGKFSPGEDSLGNPIATSYCIPINFKLK